MLPDDELLMLREDAPKFRPQRRDDPLLLPVDAAALVVRLLAAEGGRDMPGSSLENRAAIRLGGRVALQEMGESLPFSPTIQR